MRPAITRHVRLLLLIVLLGAGGLLWSRVDILNLHPPMQFVLIFLQVAVAAIPPINRRLAEWMRRFNDATPRRRALTALVIGLLGSTYLYLSFLSPHRDFFPKFHDESMHLIHAHILARGRLWLPPHPLPQFFETFHVFVTPVYTAIQFPGASMAHVPGVWLGIPYWFTCLAMAGVTIGMLYRVVAELFDDVAGLLAAIMLLGTLEFRYLSLMVLSNPVALMLGLLIVWTWLRWRISKRGSAALLIGIFIGWAAITRPVDALCFALPVCVAMMLDLWGRAASDWRKAALGLMFGAAPFLAIQLAFNRGVTGHWLQTPYELYVDQFHPGFSYGMGYSRAPSRPQTSLPQKQDYYDSFVAPDVNTYRWSTAPQQWLVDRFPRLLKATQSSFLLLPLLPASLLQLRRNRQWVLLGVLPLFITFYVPRSHYDTHYGIVCAAAMIPLAILGARAVAAAIPKWTERLTPIMAAFLLAVALSSLPQLNPFITDQYAAPSLAAVEQQLAGIKGRALVFFHYRKGVNVHEEPVYNIEAAEIDDNRIVRAQDLGASENAKLVRYYAQREPDRRVYLFDRSTKKLTELGLVSDLPVTP